MMNINEPRADWEIARENPGRAHSFILFSASQKSRRP
jgi:hypothetical protein